MRRRILLLFVGAVALALLLSGTATYLLLRNDTRADVARQLIAGSKKDIRIVYTGLRPGEKLHEELLGDGEVDYRPTHPLITHTAVPPLHPGEVLNLDPMADGEKLIAQLASLCTYEPSSAAPLE